MACDFTTIDHLGVGKPRGHVLPPFGRRKPTNMRGPDTRRTLLHARSSSKIVRPPMKACDALAVPHPSAGAYFTRPLSPINRDALCRATLATTVSVQLISGQAPAAVPWLL